MRLFLFSLLALLVSSCSVFFKQNQNKKQVVLVTTNYGNFKVKLYDDTPVHKANFLALVDSGFYDSVLFHRVIKDFMVQAGDPKSKNAPANAILGEGGPGYQLKNEILPQHIHKKGVLAAARENDAVNPERKSSGSQFYIVTGRVFSKQNLDDMNNSINYSIKVKELQRMMALPEYEETNKWLQYCRNARLDYKYDSIIHTFDPILDAFLDSVGKHEFTKEQIATYTSVGGTPHLDGGYTVFGEIIEGMNIIEKIGNVTCDQNDRPKNDVIILGMKRVKEK